MGDDLQMAAAPVVVADLSKRYHRRGPLVLDGVSLELAPGSITVLRGSNGSGKSTLLRLLAGITEPTGGRVEGRPRVVGYVPERFPSELRHSPTQYLGWLGRIRGLSGPETARRAGELADHLGLQPAARDQPMRDLSKGTTQKVAVIQALLDSPGLILLDEAWTGLDADAQAALSQLAVHSRAEGSVVVVTDHGQRAIGLAPDTTYLVEDASVRPLVATRSQVLLAGPADRLAGLAALPGVVGLEPRPGGALIVVETPALDAVLLAALGTGWSVRTVGPGERARRLPARDAGQVAALGGAGRDLPRLPRVRVRLRGRAGGHRVRRDGLRPVRRRRLADRRHAERRERGRARGDGSCGWWSAARPARGPGGGRLRRRGAVPAVGGLGAGRQLREHPRGAGRRRRAGAARVVRRAGHLDRRPAGRPLVRAPGATALGILAVAMLALIVPGSPVQSCLRVLENNRVDAARILPPVGELLLVSALVLGYALE